MKQDHYKLNQERRELVLKTIREVSDHRNWLFIAAHVRSDHVHTVVHSPREPDRILTDFKAYVSRRFNENGFDSENRKRCTRSGSKQRLYRLDAVQSAIRYTLHDQGGPMAFYLHERLDREDFREYDADTNRMLRVFLQEVNVMDDRGDVVV